MSAEPLSLGAGELSDTLDSIEACQAKSGMITWFDGGHSDPWNHVEAAMALSAGGRLRQAEAAYDWLSSSQLEDGSWFNYYAADGSVEDGRIDTNVCCYVAAGTWHHYLATEDTGFVEEMWPVLEKAISFVCRWQRPGGEVVWSIRPDGSPESYALLAGSSSIYFSLRCAGAIAALLGHERPAWRQAAGRLRHAVANRPDRFAPKARYAMDWYYPVLTGAVRGERAAKRLQAGWERFVMERHGVRCVSDQPWVTVAETAECALACLAADRRREAETLMACTLDQREADGSYATGRVYPERSTFPHEERSTYSAAAVLLGVDALVSLSAAAGFFLPGIGLPDDLEDLMPSEEILGERLA